MVWPSTRKSKVNCSVMTGKVEVNDGLARGGKSSRDLAVVKKSRIKVTLLPFAEPFTPYINDRSRY